MSSEKEILERARPPKFPLVNQSVPFIFDANIDQLSSSQFQSNIGSVAIHPLSTPISYGLQNTTESGMVTPGAAASSRSRKRAKSQGDQQSFDSLDEVEQGALVKRRLVTNTRNIISEYEQNKDEESAEQIIEETYTQLPLPSPSASPTHSSIQNEVSSIEPSNIGQQQSKPAKYENSLALVQHGDDIAECFRKSKSVNNITLIDILNKKLSKNSKNLLLYSLLETSDRTTLSILANHITKFLKFDILSNLPLELSANVLSFLDFRSLVNVSAVSRNWMSLVNKNGNVWKQRILFDNLVSGPQIIQRELLSYDEIIYKYYTINESFYSKYSAKFPRSCFEPNIHKLIYKKYYLTNKNWNNPKYEPRRISLKAHGGNVITCLQFDEDKIVIGADDDIINVFDTSTGKKIRVLRGHDGGVWGLKYIGNTLATASTDKSLRVWNLKTGKCSHILRAHNSTVRCLDIIEPTVVGKDERGDDIIYPKAPILVSGSRDHNLIMWDLSMVKDDVEINKKFGLNYSKEEIAMSLTDKPVEHTPRSKYFLGCLKGHTAAVRSISGHGNIIVSGSYDSNVRVWDVESKTCKYVLTDHSSKVYTTAIDAKRNRALSGSLDSTVNVWDLSNGSLLFSLTDHSSLVGLIQLSPKYLTTGAADATIRVWDPDTGKIRHVLQGHPGAITCFQHNDRRVISGSTSLLMWDIDTGKQIRGFLEDTTSVWQVRFNDKVCVAAVQKNEEAWIEILNFEPDRIQ
ncbi:SCF ubiquitin ligase complex subunit [Saccharomycopsis crataegensis]|uniref:SCF ubiquitin ligase complex subunit n=1 Tax=Saccharomycopsis crataegensis TaxID=43959 RepID=A0AAV5QTP7_9ASCO|nr:SCF ubiquitin ligase complex subunit [Saccharomycopsis crataegensis]